MEWLALPLTILVFTFMVQGFPNIHIGSKVNHYHYNDEFDDPTKTKK